MAIQAFRIGSGGTDTPSDVKIGFAQPSAASYYMTFEKPIGTDVQVTAGKTLYITKLRAIQSNGKNFSIVYGDNAVPDGASPPLNMVTMVRALEAGSNDWEFEMIIPIPAEKYPCVQVPAGIVGANVYFEGLEA